MQKPNPENYGPFYEGKDATAAYARYCSDLSRWEERQSTARNVIQALVSADGVGVDESDLKQTLNSDDFIQALHETHRTHQQQAVRTVGQLLWAIDSVLGAMAQMEYDDRNDGMVRYAKASIEATKSIPLPYI